MIILRQYLVTVDDLPGNILSIWSMKLDNLPVSIQNQKIFMDFFEKFEKKHNFRIIKAEGAIESFGILITVKKGSDAKK